MCLFLSYFSDFLFITGFKQFNHYIPWCLMFVGIFESMVYGCIKFGKLLVIYLNIFMLLSSLRDSNYTYVRLHKIIPQLIDELFILYIYIIIYIFLYFILNSFYCYVFKFTSPFFCVNSNLLLMPSSVIFHCRHCIFFYI